LGLNGRPSDFTTGDAHASLEDAEFLVSRIEQTLAQVSSLALSDVSASELDVILRFVDAGSLRRLDVKLDAQEVLSNVIAGALQHLRVLGALSLENLNLNEDWGMGMHAPLSSVRGLTIGGELRSDDALHIAATLTPNVQSLTVSTWYHEPAPLTSNRQSASSGGTVAPALPHPRSRLLDVSDRHPFPRPAQPPLPPHRVQVSLRPRQPRRTLAPSTHLPCRPSSNQPQSPPKRGHAKARSARRSVHGKRHRPRRAASTGAEERDIERAYHGALVCAGACGGRSRDARVGAAAHRLAQGAGGRAGGGGDGGGHGEAQGAAVDRARGVKDGGRGRGFARRAGCLKFFFLYDWGGHVNGASVGASAWTLP